MSYVLNYYENWKDQKFEVHSTYPEKRVDEILTEKGGMVGVAVYRFTSNEELADYVQWHVVRLLEGQVSSISIKDMRESVEGRSHD